MQIAGAHAAGGFVQAGHPTRDLAGEKPTNERRRGQHDQHHHDVLAQKARNDEVVHAVELLLFVDGLAQGQEILVHVERDPEGQLQHVRTSFLASRRRGYDDGRGLARAGQDRGLGFPAVDLIVPVEQARAQEPLGRRQACHV